MALKRPRDDIRLEYKAISDLIPEGTDVDTSLLETELVGNFYFPDPSSAKAEDSQRPLTDM
jgi:hypothetical protein